MEGRRNSNVSDDSYAIQEAVSMALEAERRRLAVQLEETIINQINLILSQTTVYAQTSRAQQEFSVLATLVQHLLQLSYDLQNSLNPSTLETLGLEAALEGLTRTFRRRTGIHIDLYLPHLRERLPPHIELALFRTLQSALDAIEAMNTVSALGIHLEAAQDVIRLRIEHAAGSELDLHQSRLRVTALGGQLEMDESRVTLIFPLQADVELTEREMDVIKLLADGLTNKEIALSLNVRPRTVKFHLDNIYGKLGVNSRTEAVVYAIRHGWVRPA
jgi:DNA-binding NarL/FixJ family response regulator